MFEGTDRNFPMHSTREGAIAQDRDRMRSLRSEMFPEWTVLFLQCPKHSLTGRR
jgi:hypothetical protein